MAFKISALVYRGDFKNLIGVIFSAWIAAFAPSLLNDPPRVFNSSRAPTLNMGHRGSPRRPRPYSTRRRQALSAARAPRPFARQAHRRRLLRRPRGCGSFCGGGSFHGGGSFRGGLRGGNFENLGGSVRAGGQDFREIDRAGLRHAEPLVWTEHPDASPPLSLPRLWLRRLSLPPRPPLPWYPFAWALGDSAAAG
jgi:hypothetical protein